MYKDSLQRFNEIIKVFASYGFSCIFDMKKNKTKNCPENLRKSFEELGPTFIKIGQLLSTRPDILPKEYILELSKLQDNVTPESYNDIDNVFFKEFNLHINESFEFFEIYPLASASIAQVHNAILKDGRHVIVKIQRPNIKEKINMDLAILFKIVKLTKFKLSDTIINPVDALNEILFSMQSELDFNIEAININKFNNLNKEVAFCYVPFVVNEFSGTKVLTLEKINGFKINDIRSLTAGGYDVNDLGKKLCIFFFKQVFTDGFFHGDPHPGNILIKDNKICFIDFGIMGTLSPFLRDYLNKALISIAFKDIDELISVILSVGYKNTYINKEKLHEDINYLLEKYLSISLDKIKISTLLQDIFDCTNNNNITLPKELTILIRSVIILEGVLSKICPDIQIIDMIILFVKSSNKKRLLNNLNLDYLLIDCFKFLKDIYKLPFKIFELNKKLISGRSSIQLNITNLDKSINQLNKMINRLVFSLIISSVIIGSSLILTTNAGPKIYGMSTLGILGFVTAAVLALYLLISILKSGKL